MGILRIFCVLIALRYVALTANQERLYQHSSVGESKGLREANCPAGQLWQRWTAWSQPAPPRTCSSNRDLRRRRPLGESLRTWALDRSSRSDTRAQLEDRTHVLHWQLSDLKRIQMLGEMWLLQCGDYPKWERPFCDSIWNLWWIVRRLIPSYPISKWIWVRRKDIVISTCLKNC